MKPIRAVLVAMVALALAQAALSQESGASVTVAKLKLRSLAVFKNGLGFCVRDGRVDLKDGTAVLEGLPPAALGSLWIGGSHNTSPPMDIQAFRETVSEELPALSQVELLAANEGTTVRITYAPAAGDQLRTVEGTVLAAGAERKADDGTGEPVPALSSWRPPGDAARRSEIVLLKTLIGGVPKVLSINAHLIQSLELHENARLTAKVERNLNRVRLRVEGKPASAEMTMAYLEKGLVWSPAYRIQLEKENLADVTLEAVLANDVEDLEDAEVSFVVGYPNFLYADLVSPLSLQQSVSAFLQSLAADRRSDQSSRYANVMVQAVTSNTAQFEGAVRPEAAYSATSALPGETSEDLYFYRRSGVTLKKGERARFVVFAAQVPCEHIYQWEIPDNMNVDERGYRLDSSNRKDADPQVWHVLRLENTTSRPWTTAPAFAMNGALPLAQDVLHYAPPGAKDTLKLTAATDLRGEQSQTELSRRAVQVEGRPFEEITVAGRLKVTNWKSKETSVVIRKSLLGEVLEADADGKVSKVVRKLTSLNPSAEIDWEFRLSPKQEKEVHYRVKVLVSR